VNKNSVKIHELMISRGTFFCYAGPLSEEVLTSITKVVKDQLADSESAVSIRNKVFSIFVEQAQNIIRYSGSRVDQSGVGSVSISNTDAGFLLEAINEIETTDEARVCKVLAELKAMDPSQLKAAYRERIKSGPPQGSVGAGLGFIEIARRSSRFDFSFEEHNGAKLFIYRGWVDLTA